MNISPRLRDGLIVVGISLVLWFVLKPKSKIKGKIASSKNNGDASKRIENAKIILDAYLTAIESGESASALSELNKEFVKEYSMKVYKNKQGKFVARTMDGKDVLVVN